jgi:1,4-dihydroxy-2-naphthoate octaprenyltransferase
MRVAIGVFVLLSLAAGIGLLYVSLGFQWRIFAFFLTLGVAAILAAITYTAGARPYGYAGLGDFSVFIFFGWLGVIGTFYLHTHIVNWAVILPASAVGLFSVAVLNLNNIRDISSDTLAGKRSIPVRIGRERAVKYHAFLLLIGMLSAVVFVVLTWLSLWQLLFLASVPFFIRNQSAVISNSEPHSLDPYLRQLAVSTLLFVLLFGIGHVLAVNYPMSH